MKANTVVIADASTGVSETPKARSSTATSRMLTAPARVAADAFGVGETLLHRVDSLMRWPFSWHNCDVVECCDTPDNYDVSLNLVRSFA